jgi:hypothetical protein
MVVKNENIAGYGVNSAPMVIGIVAHPDRAEMAHILDAEVGATALSWDDGTHVGDHAGGCAATHLSLLNTFLDFGDPWVVVLEDDALPVPDFRRHVTRALEYAPAPVVSLYLGTGNPSSESQQRIRQAVAAAADDHLAWVLADCLIVSSVGYAVRADLLADMVAFITDREEELPMRITRWAQHRSIDIAYTQPSLVDHDDVESIGRPWRGPYFPKRKAWNFGVRDCWCTGTVRLGYCPVWSVPKEKT